MSEKEQIYSTSELVIWQILFIGLFVTNPKTALRGSFTSDNIQLLAINFSVATIFRIFTGMLHEFCYKIYDPLIAFFGVYLVTGLLLPYQAIHWIAFGIYCLIIIFYIKYMRDRLTHGFLQNHHTYVLEKEEFEDE